MAIDFEVTNIFGEEFLFQLLIVLLQIKSISGVKKNFRTAYYFVSPVRHFFLEAHFGEEIFFLKPASDRKIFFFVRNRPEKFLLGIGQKPRLPNPKPQTPKQKKKLSQSQVLNISLYQVQTPTSPNPKPPKFRIKQDSWHPIPSGEKFD